MPQTRPPLPPGCGFHWRFHPVHGDKVKPVAWPDEPAPMYWLPVDSDGYKAWAAFGAYAGKIPDPKKQGLGWSFPAPMPPQHEPAAKPDTVTPREAQPDMIERIESLAAEVRAANRAFPDPLAPPRKLDPPPGEWTKAEAEARLAGIEPISAELLATDVARLMGIGSTAKPPVPSSRRDPDQGS